MKNTIEEFMVDGNKWYYLGHAYIFEREDGKDLLLYDDGDIMSETPTIISDEELRCCREFLKRRET